jgi:hypothetical protein
MADAIVRRAAARALLRRNLLIPRWLEGLTIAGLACSLAAVGVIGVKLLTASMEVQWSTAHVVGAAAIVMAAGLAAFGSLFYKAEA